VITPLLGAISSVTITPLPWQSQPPKATRAFWRCYKCVQKSLVTPYKYLSSRAQVTSHSLNFFSRGTFTPPDFPSCAFFTGLTSSTFRSLHPKHRTVKRIGFAVFESVFSKRDRLFLFSLFLPSPLTFFFFTPPETSTVLQPSLFCKFYPPFYVECKRLALQICPMVFDLLCFGFPRVHFLTPPKRSPCTRPTSP